MAETVGYTKAAARYGSWVIIPFFIGEILLKGARYRWLPVNAVEKCFRDRL